LNLTVMKSFYR